MGLDYDNSAFYYFCMTMLGIYAIPASLWALNYAFRDSQRDSVGDSDLGYCYPLGAIVPTYHPSEEARTSAQQS